jgi:hypothetical protein
MYSLSQAGKWAKFLAFVAGGIVLLAMLALLYNGSAALRGPDESGAVIFVAILLLFFFIIVTLIVLLFNFASKIKKGIAEQDIENIEKGMASLKVYFIIMGVLYLLWITLIIFGLAVVIFR